MLAVYFFLYKTAHGTYWPLPLSTGLLLVSPLLTNQSEAPRLGIAVGAQAIAKGHQVGELPLALPVRLATPLAVAPAIVRLRADVAGLAPTVRPDR
jgi:hypothetical protein